MLNNISQIIHLSIDMMNFTDEMVFLMFLNNMPFNELIIPVFCIIPFRQSVILRRLGTCATFLLRPLQPALCQLFFHYGLENG